MNKCLRWCLLYLVVGTVFFTTFIDKNKLTFSHVHCDKSGVGINYLMKRSSHLPCFDQETWNLTMRIIKYRNHTITKHRHFQRLVVQPLHP